MKRREVLPYTVSPEQIRAFSRLSVASRLRFLEEMARLLLEARRGTPPDRQSPVGSGGSEPGARTDSHTSPNTRPGPPPSDTDLSARAPERTPPDSSPENAPRSVWEDRDA